MSRMEAEELHLYKEKNKQLTDFVAEQEQQIKQMMAVVMFCLDAQGGEVFISDGEITRITKLGGQIKFTRSDSSSGFLISMTHLQLPRN